MRISGDKKVSRKEIAQAAGVSDAMVSFALSNTSKVKIKDATRKKILTIAEKMGYMPNFMGRALVERRSYNIGILVPEILMSEIILHYHNMINGVAQAINETDYCISIFFGANEKYYRTIKEGRVDGIIIIESRFNDKYIKNTIDIGLPTIILNIDYPVDTTQKVNCIRPDHAGFVSEAFEYFISSGCKKILSINNYTACSPNMTLLESFNNECQKQAPKGIQGTTIIPDEVNIKEQFRNIFTSQTNWDAIIIDGADYNIELCEIAKQLKLKPGIDFKLFTSNTVECNLCTGPLYIQPSKKMGTKACNVIMHMLESDCTNKKILLPYEKYQGEN